MPANAQKEAFNWYFGNGCAISFNTPGNNPVLMPASNMNAGEGSSCISDESGKLLLYTNGVDLWNGKGEIINQQPLGGHSSTTQSALIVKKPGFDRIYYIFTLDAGSYVEPPNGGLTYSVVDMAANSGKGAVLKYNIHLRDSMTEKLTATFAANGKDIWILTHEWLTNNFVAYLLTESGIKSEVISGVGSVYDGDPQNNIGYMKFSANGKYVISTIFMDNYAELLKFDDNTGYVNNPVKISFKNDFNPYGAEFSRTGNKLYISGLFAKEIYQFSTENYDSTAIEGSRILITQDTAAMSIAALQIAPNGKIYVARQETSFLGAINRPENNGFECYYDSLAVPIPHTSLITIRKGLPNICQTFYDFRIIFDYRETCEGDQLYVKAKAYPGTSGMKFKWTGPNGFNSTGESFAFYGANHTFDGTYRVDVTFDSLKTDDSIEITIRDNPNVKILGKKSILAGESITLKASKISSDYQYFWSTGETTPQITVNKEGKYRLTTTGLYGCISSDSTQLALLNLGLTSDKSVLNIGETCIGESIDAKITLHNNDMADQIIDSIYFNSENAGFSLQNKPELPYNMASLSSLDLDVRFKSDTPGEFSDTLIIIVRDFELSKLKIAFNANAIARLNFKLNDMSNQIGHGDTLRVMSDMDCGNVPLNTDLNFTVSYDASFFMPILDSIPNLVKTYIADSIRYYEFAIPDTIIKPGNNEIAYIPGYFLVGDSNRTDSFINEITTENPEIVSREGTGTITITGCAVEIRPLSFFTPLDVTIPQIINSESFTAGINGAEKGDMLVAVYNANGSIVEKSYLNFSTPADNIETTIKMNNMPSGLYFIMVSQNDETIYKKFIKNH